jgi:hypothetical protein
MVRKKGASKAKSQKKTNKKDKSQKKDKMKAQIFSLDTIVGVVIFLVIFTIFFAVLSRNAQDDTTSVLSEEAELLVNKLTKNDPALIDSERDINIVEDGNLNDKKIDDLVGKDYEELKSLLGVKGDFCIYFEDENGNIINMSAELQDPEIADRLGFGSEDVLINGLPCKMG